MYRRNRSTEERVMANRKASAVKASKKMKRNGAFRNYETYGLREAGVSEAYLEKCRREGYIIH